MALPRPLDGLWLRLRDVLLVLGQHKLRTALTMLGIAVGVWAVITLTAFGYGLQSYLQQQIDQLGSNLVIVSPGNQEDLATILDRQVQESLTMADVETIKGRIPEIDYAAPYSSAAADVRYRGNSSNTAVIGTNADFFEIRSWQPGLGRGLAAAHSTARSTVAVLGSGIAQRLFRNRNPIGEVIHIKGVAFRVIGVLEERGAASAGSVSEDDSLFVPIETFQSRITGQRHIQSILAHALNQEALEKARYEIKLTLFSRHRHLGHKIFPFTIRDSAQLAAQNQRISLVLTMLIAGIASISLVVGGIGVMNVMLAAVTERIGEIGIRRAIGATRSDIQRQFLFEAMAVTVLGGLLGLFGAYATVGLINLVIQEVYSVQFALLIDPLMALGAVAVTAFTGLVFGLYPALAAARLTPMEALRYE